MEIKFLKAKYKDASISISGSKNSALKLIPAGLLFPNTVRLNNVPLDLLDIQSNLNVLKSFGFNLKVKYNTLTILKDLKTKHLNANWQGNFRTTYLYVPFQLSNFKESFFPWPKGCNLNRGFNYHIDIWKSFGIKIEPKENGLFLKCERINCDHVVLPTPLSVGATDSAILMSLISENRITKIDNVYVTPELLDLLDFIENFDTVQIFKTGNSLLLEKLPVSTKIKKLNFKIQPDRIEAITWICVAALLNIKLKLKNVNAFHIWPQLNIFKTLGLEFGSNGKDLIVNGKNYKPKCYALESDLYKIPSDMLPIISTILTDTSEMLDTRHPKRLEAFIQEKTKDPATIFDLRQGISLTLLALKNPKTLLNFEQTLRGYSRLFKKLHAIGAKWEILL